MSASKRPSICGDSVCRAAGDEATTRSQSGSSSKNAWLQLLGLDYESFVSCGGISLAHFTPSCLSSQSIPDGPCSSGPQVRLKIGAEPSETNSLTGMTWGVSLFIENTGYTRSCDSANSCRPGQPGVLQVNGESGGCITEFCAQFTVQHQKLGLAQYCRGGAGCPPGNGTK